MRRATLGCEKDLRQIIDADRQKEIERNRATPVPIIDRLQRCTRQNIALKGHHDDGPLDSIVFPNVHTLTEDTFVLDQSADLFTKNN